MLVRLPRRTPHWYDAPPPRRPHHNPVPGWQAELEALKRTVNAECAERVRLLGLLQQLQPANGASGDLPPATADATLQSLPANRAREALPAIGQKLAFATPAPEKDAAVNWGMQRQPGRRGGRGGHGR